MDDIFSQKKERELQILRQRAASNIVTIDPNLKGFLDRYNPDVSRATLLQAQRARAPTKEELEKSVGVKTAKKLKKRRGKNLRGEVARNLREQRRFEKGERRDKPEEEPRIVGDPIPQAPGVVAQPQVDPNAQLRLAIEGRRIAAQEAQQRRLVDLLAERDARERAERQEILDRSLEERGQLLDINIRERDVSRQERDLILNRGEQEREALRGGFREFSEGQERYFRAERQEILERERRNLMDLIEQTSEERTAQDRQARIERERLLTERGAEVQELARIRERVEQQSAAEREEAKKEREGLLRELVNLTSQERQAREARETAAAEEREGILRLTLDPTINPREGGEQAQADRDFIQRQFQQGLETIERRIGESEARTQEQIRQHAERVSAVERREPIIVQQQPAGPTASEIAQSVRQALESPRTREKRTTRRRVEIEEETTDTEEEEFSPTRSARRRQREGRGTESPTPEIGFEQIAPGEEEGFSPVQSPRTTRTPQSTGREPEVFVSEAEALGAPPPAPAPQEDPRILQKPQSTGELLLEAGKNILGGAVGTKNLLVESLFGREEPKVEPKVVEEPLQRPTERIPELEGSGVLVDPANLPQEGGQELFQSQQFAGDIEALAQNAIGFVGDAAGRAAEGIEGLVNPPPAIGEQTGGALVDVEGRPIYGLGQEIEAPPPTIKPLQSEEPQRRPAVAEGAGLVEEEEEAEAQGISVPSQRNDNYRLYESIIGEIDASYTRGRSQGGARGVLPFQIVNTSDKPIKKLKPGQSVSIAQVEKSGTLGYYPFGQVPGQKTGITRIGRSELEKQIKAGKLKIDRVR